MPRRIEHYLALAWTAVMIGLVPVGGWMLGGAIVIWLFLLVLSAADEG